MAVLAHACLRVLGALTLALTLFGTGPGTATGIPYGCSPGIGPPIDSDAHFACVTRSGLKSPRRPRPVGSISRGPCGQPPAYSTLRQAAAGTKPRQSTRGEPTPRLA